MNPVEKWDFLCLRAALLQCYCYQYFFRNVISFDHLDLFLGIGSLKYNQFLENMKM